MTNLVPQGLGRGRPRLGTTTTTLSRSVSDTFPVSFPDRRVHENRNLSVKQHHHFLAGIALVEDHVPGGVLSDP